MWCIRGSVVGTQEKNLPVEIHTYTDIIGYKSYSKYKICLHLVKG